MDRDRAHTPELAPPATAEVTASREGRLPNELARLLEPAYAAAQAHDLGQRDDRRANEVRHVGGAPHPQAPITPEIVERDHTGRFATGHAPAGARRGGRPKGSRSLVGALDVALSQPHELGTTADAIVAMLCDIALGRLPPGIGGETSVKMKDRIAAAELLWNRAEGKPLQSVQSASVTLHATLPSDWDAMTLAQKRAALDGIRTRALPTGDHE